MSERDVYPLVDRVIEDGKRRINAADSVLTGELLGAYQDARHSIAAELAFLEEQIRWSIENNEDRLTAAWVRRQDWYRDLDATIQREAAMLESTTRRVTVGGRMAGIAEAGETGRQMIRGVPWAGMNPRPVEHWIAAIQPGSPVDGVLSRYGTRVESTLKREITQGLVQGRGSQSIAADLGDIIPPSDASRIVRTETMRAYRGVYQDQMQAMPADAIAGYRWVSALDSRTCAICIGLHGQVFETYPDFFHPNCRCTVSPVFSERYAPPREFTTGEQWLREQSEEQQCAILGPARFEVWSEGSTLPGMIQFGRDPVWGGSTRLTPMRELRP